MVSTENASGASSRRAIDAIDSACKALGGVYAQYGCKTVSWDDAERGTKGGVLSSWGANITDTRLWAKSGELLFTCRPDNWNEKLGKVNAHQVALVVEKEPDRWRPITLATYLQNAGLYAAYAGLEKSTDLYDETVDQEISIRFQTTFLPVRDRLEFLPGRSRQEFPSIEFCSEAYNYNTWNDDDPRNAILLCTTQGTAFSQDGVGANRLFHHSVDCYGKVRRYWLEAEQTKHKVGGQQKETKEEAQAAAARNKATASVVGVPAMGTRFNVLMTIQVPLEQDPGQKMQAESTTTFNVLSTMAPFKKPVRAKGNAHAARVSLGSEVEGPVWGGVKVASPKRDSSQHVTVTVVLYNTVVGGVPSVEDVQAAIDDMEQLYESCRWAGALSGEGASFMKAELTEKDVRKILTKVITQPYKPKGFLVEDGDTFPAQS